MGSFFRSFCFLLIGVSFASLYFESLGFAQTSAGSKNVQRSTPAVDALPEITVLGEQSKTSPLDFVPTVSEISGTKLDRKKTTSLGETLGHEVGVSSSFFGPNSSRPVIRGMDGERIRVLANGTGVLDASAASQDHETVVEPMSIERVEIVRGPSALLYGSSAVGGVVNVITNRIPEKAQEGLSGKFDSRYTSVDGGGVGALNSNYGKGPWVLHFDASSRAAADYHIPGFARTEALRNDPSKALDADSEEGDKRVPNSANHTSNGALGGSYIFQDGFVGASYAKYDSEYGTVAEQGVRIQMKQERYDMALGMKNLGWIESLNFKNTYSNYRHQEVENGVVGTTFTNKGDEARIELKHQKVGDFNGFIGMQSNIFDFEAIGEERFLPKTNNQNLAVFAYEEAEYGSFKPSLGLRLETSSVKADETFIDVDPTNLGEASAGGPSDSKSFAGGSSSLGLMYSLDATNAIVLNLAYTERAPNYQELYANGPHLATKAYERGDAHLQKEKSQSVEISYRHKDDNTKGSFGLFLQDFQDYIAQSPQAGGGFDPDGAAGNRDLQLYQYTAMNARFYGAELELTHSLANLLPHGVLELGAKFDMVKAKNRSTNENIPRITPMRETISMTYKANAYTADLEVQKVEKQTDLAPNETATDAYTMVNLGVEKPIEWDTLILSFYARINNAFDVEARNHVSVLKDIAPLPGRNYILGIQANF